MDEFLGTIKLFAGLFAPRGWMLCDGSLIPINRNEALYSIIGTTYGGDGVTTFALPDLRGRAPIGAGAASGVTERQVGEITGSEPSAQPAVDGAYTKGTANRMTDIPPSLVVNYIICVEGLYPSRPW